jgi:mono/diheme cytochrome c family protein
MSSRCRAILIYPTVAAALVPLSLARAFSDANRPEGDAGNGRRLFRTTARCILCHTAEGQGGKSGPDLGHIGAKRDAPYIAAKIGNPRLGLRSTMMPSASALKLKGEDVADLVAYLSSLK